MPLPTRGNCGALSRIARDYGLLPAIAVVPERADDSLARLLCRAECCVWQHGWGHHTHTAGEFGEGRALDLMERDALAGQESLDRLFGPRGWQRVFVPPFHLLSMRFKAAVPRLGYRGVSAGVQLTPPIDHVTEVNAEVDVMNWPEGKMFSNSTTCGTIVDQLVARRTGKTPISGPIGLLTHHLVFGETEWRSFSTLLAYLSSHPSVEFLRADRLFEMRALNPAGPPPPEPRRRVTSGNYELRRQTGSAGTNTLDSFSKYNTYPVREYIVMEDGDGEKNRILEAKYRQHNFQEWLSTKKRVGQIAALVDAAYRNIKTEFIFHCEDDWEFTSPGFMEKSLAVLTSESQHFTGMDTLAGRYQRASAYE